MQNGKRESFQNYSAKVDVEGKRMYIVMAARFSYMSGCESHAAAAVVIVCFVNVLDAAKLIKMVKLNDEIITLGKFSYVNFCFILFFFTWSIGMNAFFDFF